jgi:hypothetical protein
MDKLNGSIISIPKLAALLFFFSYSAICFFIAVMRAAVAVEAKKLFHFAAVFFLLSPALCSTPQNEKKDSETPRRMAL